MPSRRNSTSSPRSFPLISVTRFFVLRAADEAVGQWRREQGELNTIYVQTGDPSAATEALRALFSDSAPVVQVIEETRTASRTHPNDAKYLEKVRASLLESPPEQATTAE